MAPKTQLRQSYPPKAAAPALKPVNVLRHFGGGVYIPLSHHHGAAPLLLVVQGMLSCLLRLLHCLPHARVRMDGRGNTVTEHHGASRCCDDQHQDLMPGPIHGDPSAQATLCQPLCAVGWAMGLCTPMARAPVWLK